MGIEGVAYGTVIAQYLGLIMAALLWWLYYKKLNKYYHFNSIFNVQKMINFFKVNTDIFLRSFCMVMAFSSFIIFSTRFSDTILAVNTLLNQLFLLFSYFMDGFAYAGEALAGKYIGAKDEKMLRKAVRNIFYWGYGLTALFTVLYLFFGDALLSILTNSETILTTAENYLYWVLLVPICGFAAFLWDGIYIGATASKAMRNIVFVATAAYYITFYALHYGLKLQNDALWAALIVFLLVRGIGMYVCAKNAIYLPLKK